MLDLASVLDEKAVVLRKRLAEVWPAFRALSALAATETSHARLRATLANPTVPEVRSLRSALTL